ncbi:MAG: MerR family transcriptional regulator [Flavobacteriales bacterium]|jgi:DNA-binding transcriptional MerR regulator
MIPKASDIEKLYYSIGEVAEMFEVNSSLIRFWEKEFPQLHPRKNSRGNRVYSKKDIELFRKIHHLVKEKGYTLEGAKNALRKREPLDEGETLVGKLTRVRSELLNIANGL